MNEWEPHGLQRLATAVRDRAVADLNIRKAEAWERSSGVRYRRRAAALRFLLDASPGSGLAFWCACLNLDPRAVADAVRRREPDRRAA